MTQKKSNICAALKKTQTCVEYLLLSKLTRVEFDAFNEAIRRIGIRIVDDSVTVFDRLSMS